MIYKELQVTLEEVIESSKCKECLFKKAHEEKVLDQLERGQDVGTLESLFRCKACESRPPHRKFMNALREHSHTILEKLEMAEKVQEQAIFKAYSDLAGVLATQDYSKVNVQYLIETFRRDFLGVCESLKVREAVETSSEKVREEQIKEKMPEYLKLLRRIRDFCEEGVRAYKIKEGEK